MEPSPFIQVFEQAPQTGAAVGIIAIFIWLFVVLIATAIAALIYCRIFHKAGYSWALGLLMFVLIANIIMPFVLAFGTWPIETKLRQLEQQATKPPQL